MKVLSALMAKSDQIEAALHTKADVSAMEDLAMRITCVDQTAGKLLQSNQDLRKDLDKSFEETRQSNVKLGEAVQCKIEEKVSKLECSVNNQNKLDSHLIHDCVQGAIQVQHQEDLVEQEDIQRRKNHVILHGLSESSADDAETRKKDDESHIMEILHKIECDDVSVDSIIRLGKKPEADEDRPRPILLKFPSEAAKKSVLYKSKNLRVKKVQGLERIFVHQDLTPKQRECRRKLVKELRDRVANGETNLTIWNERIIQRRIRVMEPQDQ